MAKQNKCEIHAQEPCGPNCNGECDSAWHHRKAVVHDLEYGWICEECRAEIGSSRAYERHNQAQYDYACGYRD